VFVIQDLDETKSGAGVGEIVARVCRSFGAVGLVTNGFVRDVGFLETLAFRCFAEGTISSHGYSRFLSFGEPVTVGGVVIRPGDLLHGDANGVTTIPLDIAAAVADNCQAYIDAEQILVQAAESGDLRTENGGKAWDAFKAAIRDLTRKLGTTADTDSDTLM
jgi:regulator of RNase E activity RraA